METGIRRILRTCEHLGRYTVVKTLIVTESAQPAPALQTWKLTLAYDGTEFRGWQVQPGERTIQGELQAALGRITGESPLPQGSGRTEMCIRDSMISGLLAPQEGRFTLVGDESLSRRPMERILRPLAAMGARLALTEGHAPLHLSLIHI